MLKNHQNCSLSWSHIWKVSFWDLNVENLVHLTWNDPNLARHLCAHCPITGRQAFPSQTLSKRTDRIPNTVCVLTDVTIA
jgi:hypothetical protein